MSRKNLFIAHLLYRFDVGGLERFMVDMINRFPSEYRHVVISLTSSTHFEQQLKSGVEVYCLEKKPGQDFATHLRLWKLLHRLRPQLLHSYNIATIEYHSIAWLAGVKGHLHAEHGREITDPQGLNWKHNLLRRLLSPFLQEFVAVSTDLATWLTTKVKIPTRKVSMIANGIDLVRYVPKSRTDTVATPIRFLHVARLQGIKNQKLLISAFARLIELCKHESISELPNLTIVGDGPLQTELKELATSLNCKEHICFAGMQLNVIDYYQSHDVFVLSSIAEGTPMTILEAMACGLPIVSTRVGGIPAIVSDQIGNLVPNDNPEHLCRAMMGYINNPSIIYEQGIAARKKVEMEYDQRLCDEAYQRLYQRACS